MREKGGVCRLLAHQPVAVLFKRDRRRRAGSHNVLYSSLNHDNGLCWLTRKPELTLLPALLVLLRPVPCSGPNQSAPSLTAAVL